MKPLTIIPTYLAVDSDIGLVRDCMMSLHRTAGDDTDVLIVDDGSPRQDLVAVTADLADVLGFEVHRKSENTGFSSTVNVGLARARDEGRDAVLANADIEFIERGWLERMEAQQRQDGAGPASVVGALLLYPNGLIQHAGIFFSLLHRQFDHRFRYAPADLPEAQQAFRCPVTAALQFIRHETLIAIGLYDENFRLGFEDVSYTIEVFKAGGDCVYQPAVRAFHHESIFRGRKSRKLADWQARSWIYFTHKHRHDNFAQYLPTWI